MAANSSKELGKTDNLGMQPTFISPGENTGTYVNTNFLSIEKHFVYKIQL